MIERGGRWGNAASGVATSTHARRARGRRYRDDRTRRLAAVTDPAPTLGVTFEWAS
jgi:hypothetical protein